MAARVGIGRERMLEDFDGGVGHGGVSLLQVATIRES